MGVISVGDHDITGINVHSPQALGTKCLRDQTAGPAFSEAEQPVERARR